MDDGICVSKRSGDVRFSPHLYTSGDDVGTAIDVLDEYASPT